MSWALALCGWAVAAWLALRLRRRMELVADAEHELRGALTAVGLALERVRLGGYAALLRLQLERAGAALADLERARAGRRADGARPGRLAQLLANLIANATEHGVGQVEVRSARRGEVVRLEIRNRNRASAASRSAAGRGRGLGIAARAAQELGGPLHTEARDGSTVATVELPLERAA